MNREDRRLQTFRRWPHGAQWVATPLKLAKSGFYLSATPQYPDRVVCFCCGIALVHWNRSHDPWTEHAKRSPICGLITGAYNAHFMEQKRLSSFVSWPLPPNFAAKPQKLALAGFFHCPSPQFNDRCVCFCCGIALVKWEKNDDPWTEHVKHARSCPFVRGKEVGNVPIAEEQPEEEIESTLRKMVEQIEALDVDAGDSAPSYFLCPITQDFFLEPVVAEDGHTYEREAIKKWFESHNTSPLTNKRLYSKKVYHNHNLRSQLIEYCEKILNTHAKTSDGPQASNKVASSSNQMLASSSSNPDARISMNAALPPISSSLQPGMEGSLTRPNHPPPAAPTSAPPPSYDQMTA